jgi:hypothetical protein
MDKTRPRRGVSPVKPPSHSRLFPGDIEAEQDRVFPRSVSFDANRANAINDGNVSGDSDDEFWMNDLDFLARIDGVRPAIPGKG